MIRGVTHIRARTRYMFSENSVMAGFGAQVKEPQNFLALPLSCTWYSVTRKIAHPGDNISTSKNVITGCAVVGGGALSNAFRVTSKQPWTGTP